MTEPASDTPAPEPRAGSDDLLARTRAAVLTAALPQVAFDGWSDRTLARAVETAGETGDVDPGLARLAFPRGGVDLALAYHYSRDADLAEALGDADLIGLRFRDRIAHAVALRLELVSGDREAVRRAMTLFALPHHAPDGARAIWHTADVIWKALGDTSRDVNWYTKRTTLSAVLSSSLLYWLGDDSPDMQATREFIQRRIDNIMQVETLKARVAQNPLGAVMMKGPQRLLDRVRAPDDTAAADLPGRWPGRG